MKKGNMHSTKDFFKNITKVEIKHCRHSINGREIEVLK